MALGVAEDLDRPQDVERLGAVDGEDEDAADRWHADDPATGRARGVQVRCPTNPATGSSLIRPVALGYSGGCGSRCRARPRPRRGGCGTADDRDQARGVVQRFYHALEEGRGRDACTDLSAATVAQLESQSGQRCARVVTRLELEGGAVAETEVFITNAQRRPEQRRERVPRPRADGLEAQRDRHASPSRASRATGRWTARCRPDARPVRAHLLLIVVGARRSRSSSERWASEALPARELAHAVLPGALPGRARRPGLRRPRGLQPRAGRPPGRAGLARALRHLVGATSSTSWRTGSRSTCSSRSSSSRRSGSCSAGSTESKPLGKEGGESDEEQKVGEHAAARLAGVGEGRRLADRSSTPTRSCCVMAAIWLGSWLAQLVTGRVVYNAEQFDHQEAALIAVAVRGLVGLLEPHAAELAVGVPRRRVDGRVLDLAAPARLAGVQAGRRAARQHGRGGLGPPGRAGQDREEAERRPHPALDAQAGRLRAPRQRARRRPCAGRRTARRRRSARPAARHGPARAARRPGRGSRRGP